MWWILAGLVACDGEPGPQGSVEPPAPDATCEDQDLLTDVDGACVPAGCGLAPWGPADDGSPAVYVLEGGSGDGSAEAPLGSITEAIALAGEEGVDRVVVGAGSYAESILLSRGDSGITVSGRCPEQVVLDGAGLGDASGVTLSAAEASKARVEGLTVRGFQLAGVVGLAGALTFARARVEDCAPIAVVVEDRDAVLKLEDVVIRGADAGRESVTGGYGAGVAVADADTVTLERVEVSGTDGAGLFILSGTVSVTGTTLVDNGWTGIAVADGSADAPPIVTLDGVRIEATRARDADNPARGFTVESGGSLTAVGLTVEGVDGHGGLVVDAGTVVSLQTTTVRDTSLAGLAVYSGGRLTVRETVIEGAHGAGVIAFGETDAVRVDLVDVTVQGTVVAEVSGYGDGQGLLVTGMGDVSALRLVTRDNPHLGLLADAGMRVVGQEVQALDNGTGGLAALDGSSLVCRDCLVSGNGSAGVFAADSEVELWGGEVRGSTVWAGDGAFGGYGVWFNAFGTTREAHTLILEGVTVSGNRIAGVVLQGGSASAELTDVTISGTLLGSDARSAVGLALSDIDRVVAAGLRVEDNGGPGVAVAEGTFEGEGCTFRGNAGAGVLALDAGVVSLAGGSVADTVPDSSGGGFGVAAVGEGVDLSLDGVEVSGNPLAGLYVDASGAVRVDGGAIRGGTPPDGGVTFPRGNGIFATGATPWDGAAGLLLSGVLVADSSGGGLFLDAASATLQGTSWSGNPVDVVQQRCDGVAPVVGVEEAGTTELCPTYDEPTAAWSWGMSLVVDDPEGS